MSAPTPTPPSTPTDAPDIDGGFKPDEGFEDPDDIQRIYGDHIWGRKTKKSKLVRWIWYPLWDITTGDFRQWYFGTMPQDQRMAVIREQAQNLMKTPDYADLPDRVEVIGRDREISIFLTSIYYHIIKDETALKMKKPPPKVFLVKGEPGSGKTHLIQAVMRMAFERTIREGFLLNLKKVKFANLTSEYVGVMSKNVQKLFNDVLTKPTFMFLDEANSLVQKGAVSGEAATREYQATEGIFLQSLDTLMRRPVRSLVVLSSNTSENIREDIRRRCFLIDLDNPGLSRESMVDIVAYQLGKYNINLNAEEVMATLEKALRELGEGKMVPHDLERAMDIVVTESEKPIREAFEKGIKNGDVAPNPITLESFKAAAKDVRAYKLQEVTSAVKEASQSLAPDTRYEDVGGLDDIKEDVINEIHLSLHPQEAGEMWLPPRGYLFHGPPGTGKTLLAKAICGEEKVSWFYIKGPSLYAKWVGESEQSVRDLFKSAKAKSPSIIFMDEIDSVGRQRGAVIGDSGVSQNVLTTLLSELDGANPLGRVVFIGSTNRRDSLDGALLERLDKQFLFSNPKTTSEKLDVIRAQMRKYTKHTDLTPEEIYKVFLRRTSSPRVMHDTIGAAGRLAMTEQIACRKLVKAMEDLDHPEQIKKIRSNYRKAFARIQESILGSKANGSGEDREFNLNDEYRKIAEKNLITVFHLERAFKDKFETDADRMEKTMSEMHRSSAGLPGKGYGLWANDEGKGGIGVIEAQIFPAARGKGRGSISVYGNVGKGTEESAKIGRSFLRQFCPKVSDLDIELHFISSGEGGESVAVSGPSAGQALMFTMMSALIVEPFNPEVCMTGKIDLNGIAGMVGGIQPKQNTGKLDAARAYNFKKILIPKTAYEEIAKEFPEYLAMSSEQGTEIIGGETSWDYAKVVFPNIKDKDELLQRLAKA
jgi:transitional endoplasmic reticulum ATPase